MSSISSEVRLKIDDIRYVGLRIDTVLSELTDVPRNRIQNYIKEQFVKLNGSAVKKNYKLKLNDVVTVCVPEVENDEIEANDADIKILYEDDYIVVVDKPAFLVVHPGAAKEKVSVVSALKFRNIKLSSVGAPLRPGVVHRIDKDTSGVIVLAKTDKMHFLLAKQFFSHTIDRRYIGVVYGNMNQKEGVIDKPIARHRLRRKEFCVAEKGKSAKTHYKVIKRLDGMDVVLFKLFTGRTHQIRVHMKYINHPLVGDRVYYKKKEERITRQALHAFYLGFEHPINNAAMRFYSKLPDDIMKIIKDGG